MRPINDAKHANIGPSLSSKRFRLDASAEAHLVSVLTNVYSDQLAAFVRELSTNAADSHISARVTRPIEVTLPTASNPFFAVEDFGLGLSIDELEGVYSSYGASTKRDDDDVNGTLGLGSKAPLAYADTFNVQARQGGVQVLATVAKDYDGVPVLDVLDTCATDLPDGVRIEVPVRDHHFGAVRNKAVELFQYWAKGTVLVDGRPPASIRDRQDLVWLDDDVAVSTTAHRSLIVQHGVAYPVDSYRLDLPYGVIAFVPTGTVNFPPSREALEYTDRTEAVLDTLKEYVNDAFGRRVRAQIEAAETTYERLLLVQTWRSYVPEVAQDFFGKAGFSLSIGSHGFAWRYRPEAYRHKATRVDHLRANDIIGDWPLVTGYDLKTLTAKARLKLDVYFDERDIEPDQLLLLPTGTNLSVAQGRKGIITWAEIDAATQHVKTPRSGSSKGQTEYTTWFQGRDLLTLSEAKKLIAAEEIATVAYVGEGEAHRVTSKLPDVFIFEIKRTQVDKIVRETGAVSAWDVLAERAQAAREALTETDQLKASLTRFSFPLYSAVVGHSAEILDPELRALAEIIEAPDSVTLQQYRAFGESISYDPADTVDPIAARYPLVGEVGTYANAEILAEARFYINARWASLQEVV